MFEMLERSWRFAKISFRILFENKSLLIFPILSGLSIFLVLLGFLVPQFLTGSILDYWAADAMEELTIAQQVGAYAALFIVYFCEYAVVIFFNTALTFCAMEALEGRRAGVGYGLRMASTRIGAICGWALLCATVGIIFDLIERFSKKLGKFIVALMGAAWAILSFFVIPLIAAEGLGPKEALKRSVDTLKLCWGDGLLGRFSFSLIAMLLFIPIHLAVAGIMFLAISSKSLMGLLGGLLLSASLYALGTAIISAGSAVFRTILFNFATVRMLPADVNRSELQEAFRVDRADI
jgi:hypothetical protein